MNFFKSILLDDSDPPESEKSHRSEPNFTDNPSQNLEEDVGDGDDDGDVVEGSDQSSALRGKTMSSPNHGTDTSDGGGGGGWSFGGLIKTLSTRSESVLETYRRDLQEFGSGLKKETALFREAASRAVKDLPASVEVGASVAHGSIESVSHTFDGVLKSTAEIISQGKETLLLHSDIESDTPDNQSTNSRRYSWFDSQLRSTQSDTDTYCEEPEDLEEYNKWKSGFTLNDKIEEIKNLIGENEAVNEIYNKLVPNTVDHETFWCRYFYRIHKLKQQETVRAKLVNRAISIDNEEELTWDVDDDEEDDVAELKKRSASEINRDLPQTPKKDEQLTKETRIPAESNRDLPQTVKEDEQSINKTQIPSQSNRDLPQTVKDNEKSIEETRIPSSDATHQVEKGNKSVEEDEEEFGWDEIEDLGSNDEKIIIKNGDDLRKRLSHGEEDDEDLSWDIEEDDDEQQPVKA